VYRDLDPGSSFPPDPDPGYGNQHFFIFQLKKLKFFEEKNCSYLKGFQTTEEASSAPKRTSNTSKYEI
jgi:hypothetical protein